MNLQYLDLEIPKNITEISCSNSRHKCHFKGYSHNLHGENPQLNTLIDMMISLAKSLETSHKEWIRCMTQVTQKLDHESSNIKEIQENHHYIKTQLESLCIKNDNGTKNPCITSLKQIETQLVELKRIALT